MSDISVRADSVNVEEIMRQIRARVKEKRGADYTEEEIKELAGVKLEKFLDPLAVRSGLLEEYRNARSTTTLADIEPAPDLYGFDEESIYASTRGGLLRSIRRLLNPILKLFFNPNPLIRVLNMQAALNGYFTRSIARVGSREALNFEVLHNVVVELTRLSIENRNLKMRVESLNTRLDFAERRARALEGVVQYKPGASAVSLTTLEPVADASLAPEDADKAGRRRRRRRGRRRGPGEGGPGEGGEGNGAEGFAEGEGGSDAGSSPSAESRANAAGDGGAEPSES
ncbi:hypothetical protein TBR22_A05170 [Luteitalea sp. TBR-22]|uniref:hypothetical protein n=1 Tax=Luteitalea sp. TBR-22 TaxID=2802971 RepID=UPI001AF4AEDF|nr:hypothetical protein [Luteitalea sp. TBR-22]BCS31317.1 hypothetical protein TBR22_A05170 [Luteitalea sp. TBR-22]